MTHQSDFCAHSIWVGWFPLACLRDQERKGGQWQHRRWSVTALDFCVLLYFKGQDVWRKNSGFNVGKRMKKHWYQGVQHEDWQRVYKT